MYRRAGKGRLLLLAFIALSIVVITLDFRQDPSGPLERAKEISSAIVTPIQRGLAAVFRPVGNFFSSLADINDLKEENADLRVRLEELESAAKDAESLEAENIALREEMGLGRSYATMERVTASVIGRPPSNYKWAITIDKGRADGIREDMAVVDPDGLVGKVINVDERTATVLLLIDPQAAASVRMTELRYTGTIRGNGGNLPLSLEFIDPDVEADVGDPVVTSGLDGSIFPPSIPIGRVSAIAGQEAALEQDIEVEPWVDFTALDFVDILIDTGAPPPRKGGD